MMKRSDISDEHVLGLARQWREDHSKLGVVRALIAEGIPEKVALRKVEHMIQRGLLECGVSLYYPWPT